MPEFAEVAFKLDEGPALRPGEDRSSAGTSSSVEDKRTKPPPAFEQVKDQIETFVQRKAQAEYVTKLREAAKIERLGQAGGRRTGGQETKSARSCSRDPTVAE